MSSTVDANILLYASDSSSDKHAVAEAFLRRWVAGPDLVYLFWPTVMAYLRIATHPRIFDSPLEPREAAANISALLDRSNVRTGSEDETFWELLARSSDGVVLRGNIVPDAHLVALMRQHGVNEIWTRHSDFRRFDGIRPRDPFSG